MTVNNNSERTYGAREQAQSDLAKCTCDEDVAFVVCNLVKDLQQANKKLQDLFKTCTMGRDARLLLEKEQSYLVSVAQIADKLLPLATASKTFAADNESFLKELTTRQQILTPDLKKIEENLKSIKQNINQSRQDLEINESSKTEIANALKTLNYRLKKGIGNKQINKANKTRDQQQSAQLGQEKKVLENRLEALLKQETDLLTKKSVLLRKMIAP